MKERKKVSKIDISKKPQKNGSHNYRNNSNTNNISSSIYKVTSSNNKEIRDNSNTQHASNYKKRESKIII